jgi:hypothetical protein
MKKINLLSALGLMFMLSACQPAQLDSKNQLMGSESSQVAIRSIQTRAFDTNDQKKTLRTVIATLQDLGFVIDKADDDLGTVSATKLDGFMLKMTVTAKPHGQKQMSVRANAQYNLTAVEDPAPYQQFFAALEKSMFLTAHEID